MERYEVRVAGSVGVRRATALGCVVIGTTPEHTVLSFAAVDATALYGLIARLRDAGLELVAITRTPATRPRAAGTREESHERS